MIYKTMFSMILPIFSLLISSPVQGFFPDTARSVIFLILIGLALFGLWAFLKKKTCFAISSLASLIILGIYLSGFLFISEKEVIADDELTVAHFNVLLYNSFSSC